MGREFVREALQHYEFVKDPEVVGAVNEVGRRIVEAIGSNPASYHFLIVREDQPNAFAIPGGYIFVFDGLLMQVGDLSELAGVLSHEIAHVERNHFFKDEKKTAALDIATIAAILLGGGSPASLMIAGAANLNVRLQFSRENETEADSYAVRFLKKAGYDPMGLPGFFKSMLRYERFNPQMVPAYLSTHPDMEVRFNRLEGLLEKDAPVQVRGSETDWGRISAILAARGRATREASALWHALRLDQLPSDLGPEKREERQHYLMGLTYLKANQVSQAIPEYLAAIGNDPGNPAYTADLSLAYLRRQDLKEARAAAEQSLQSDPLYAPAHVVLGMLEESSDNPAEATRHFEEAVRLNPADPVPNLHLSMIYGKGGDPLQETLYRAYYYRLNLEPEKALRELKRAQSMAGENSPQNVRILRDIEEIQREGL
jgi:predicted Zn-dependent protease